MMLLTQIVKIKIRCTIINHSVYTGLFRSN